MKNYLPCALMTGVLCSIALPALADDQIQLYAGRTVRGTIIAMTPSTVSIETRDGDQDISVSDIDRIEFHQEPAAMSLARNAALGGRYEDALRYIDERIKEEDLPAGRARELNQDIKYFTAYSKAQLALSGQGNLTEAKGLLGNFISANATSYHNLAANALLGDVESALGNHAAAETAYNTLTTSGSPLYERRGLVAKGYAMLKQGKAGPAASAFGQVTSKSPGEDAQMKKYHIMAQLGKAACLGETGDSGQAEKAVRQIIADTEEDQEIYARAFNTLGGIYRKSNQSKKALLEYLKVHKLYFTVSQEHAEALYYLAELWPKVDTIPGNQQYGQECAALLKERYANSSWAQ